MPIIMIVVKTMLLTLLWASSVTVSRGYEVGCIYPKAMPDPVTAQDIMVHYAALTLQKRAVETPIAVHNALISALCGVGCLAAHDPTVKDPTTGNRPLLVVPEFGHNAFSVAMCSLQCHTLALGQEAMQPLLDRWNVPIKERWHPDLAFLDTVGNDPSNDDLLRAFQVVQDNDYHPYIIGQLMASEIFVFFVANDGWNSFGRQSYDMLTQSVVPCTANCMDYSDLSGYFPRNQPGRPYTEETKYNVTGDDMYWQPLLEDDGYGYFSRQQHVVPHLATTAKPNLDPDLRNRTVAAPEYDYHEEALKVVEELRLTAEDEDRRAKIEFFDNKFSVRGLFQHATRNQFESQHSYQRHLLYVLGLSLAEDDGVVLAWTEKVRHDLVRPTTVIQRWGGDKLMTYGGSPARNKAVEIAARNFEAYIRVMPHSEFPSGSACLCTTYREFADAFTQQHYNGTIDSSHLVAGVDGYHANCDGEIIDFPPQVSCNYSFTLKDMTELEEVCGQSRLWGGMHFSTSVPAGHELCGGLGTMALDKVNEITADSNFGGNEWFAGDDRPVCSDPDMDQSGPAAGDTTVAVSKDSLENSSGSVMLGGAMLSVSVALAHFVLFY